MQLNHLKVNWLPAALHKSVSSVGIDYVALHRAYWDKEKKAVKVCTASGATERI